MKARQAILDAVRAARPAGVALPDVDASRAEFPATAHDVIGRFIAASRAGGAEVIEGERGALARATRTVAPTATTVLSGVPSVQSTVSRGADSHALAKLDLFVCEAVLGVAENGAVWLPLSHLAARGAAFLAEHVVVALDRLTIVSDFHEAYDRIDVGAEAFGVFVAGPSKTADIEQSLVIGAHGPKRLTIVLL